MANNTDMRLYTSGTEEELRKFSESWRHEMLPFVDRLSEFPDVKLETVVGVDEDGKQIVRHERFDGVVIEGGTPLTAFNLGKLDFDTHMLYLQFSKMMGLIDQLLIEMAALKGATIGGTPNNIYWSNARNLGGDVILVEGFYDEANGKCYV